MTTKLGKVMSLRTVLSDLGRKSLPTWVRVPLSSMHPFLFSSLPLSLSHACIHTISLLSLCLPFYHLLPVGIREKRWKIAMYYDPAEAVTNTPRQWELYDRLTDPEGMSNGKQTGKMGERDLQEEEGLTAKKSGGEKCLQILEVLGKLFGAPVTLTSAKTSILLAPS